MTRLGRQARGWLLLPIALSTGALYALYLAQARRMISAEPTLIWQVLPWVRPFTPDPTHAIPGNAVLGTQVPVIAGLFILYGCAVALLRGAPGRLMLWAGAAAALYMGMMVCSPATLSSDTAAYAFYGRLVERYHANPYLARPTASEDDPFLAMVKIGLGPSRYGPLWTMLSAGVTRWAGDNLGLALLLFRIINAASTLAAAGLIWLILRRLRPADAALGTMLYLWNPTVLLESALGGHNDAMMVALALLAPWLHLRGQKGGAVAALGLSVLVKAATAPLVPLYLLAMLREKGENRARLLLRAGVALALLAGLTAASGLLSSSSVLAGVAGSASTYHNQYHELIFRQLRRAFGEKESTIYAPIEFHPWWVAARVAAPVYADISTSSREISLAPPERPLLALSNNDGVGWVRVFDTRLRGVGFIRQSAVTNVAPPADAMRDPVVRAISTPPAEWPTVVKANRWIRIATWLLLGLFALLAAWRVRGFGGFLFWSALFLLYAQVVVLTQIWPWYALWPLAFCVLLPGSSLTVCTVLLSLGQACIYLMEECCDSPLGEWFEHRSLLTVLLPMALGGLWMLASRVRSRREPARHLQAGDAAA